MTTAKQTVAKIAALDTPAAHAAPTYQVQAANHNHAPRFHFAKDGAEIYGFLTTGGDFDQVGSRTRQSELILAYASARGWKRPYIQGDASRETLFRVCPPGAILVVPRLATLFQKPSHVSDVVQWSLRKNITVHAVEAGGPIDHLLPTIRQCGECFTGLEAEIVSLRQQLKDQAASREAELQEFATMLLAEWNNKQRGLAQQIADAKERAAEALKDGTALTKAKELAERRAAADQFLKDMGYEGPAPAPEQDTGWRNALPPTPWQPSA